MKTKRSPQPVPRRTPDEARAEIILVARDFLMRRPFHEMTVGRLMERTQTTRSAFYAHFKDVYDLAEVFVHELSQSIEDGSAQWIRGEGEPVEEIRKSLESGIALWEAEGPLIRALAQASLRDKRLERIWRDQMAGDFAARLAKIIRRDQSAGLIPPMDAAQMAEALIQFNIAYLNARFGSDTQSRPKRAEVLALLQRVWLGTLYGSAPPRPGRRRT